MEYKKINMVKFKSNKGTSFSGRPQGESCRELVKLNLLDNEDDLRVQIVFPEDTTSINPSFFLGMFYDSIKFLGLDNFHDKYEFIFETIDEKKIHSLNNDINDGIRNALNSLTGNTGRNFFKKFFKK